MQTDSAINAGREIDPVPVCSFGVFAWAFVNTGNRAGIDAICDAFTGIRYDRMRHSVLLS